MKMLFRAIALLAVGFAAALIITPVHAEETRWSGAWADVSGIVLQNDGAGARAGGFGLGYDVELPGRFVVSPFGRLDWMDGGGGTPLWGAGVRAGVVPLNDLLLYGLAGATGYDGSTGLLLGAGAELRVFGSLSVKVEYDIATGSGNGPEFDGVRAAIVTRF